MPEIAEVETVKRILQKKVIGKTITAVEIIYPKTVINDLEEFKSKIINQTITDVQRQGKWLIFEMTDLYLLSHLRMEGRYQLKKADEPILKHEHVILYFNDGTCLKYADSRKFGRMMLVDKQDLHQVKELNKLGIEPLTGRLTEDYLLTKFKHRRLPIKSLLLDQTIISGLGNIYANEVLFAAKINPWRLGNTITNKEMTSLIKETDRIIEEAIKMGGTTIHSFAAEDGVFGNYQDKLQVHGRLNKPCNICQTLIKKDKINGRGTYYCPKCQK